MAEIIEANGHTIDAVLLRRALIAWGQRHFRRFPWRLTKNPYRILIAEVMLHRTQALQVVPVYQEFIKRYSDVPALAQATKKELRQALYSLGLRWRIDLVRQMSVELTECFDSRIPRKKTELLSLPGVSEYIAGAIRCFSWNQPEPLIDTNTVRVIGRLFGLEIKDSSRRNRQFGELIATLVDPDEPRMYNYALLDLADQVCTKKRSPNCVQCPVQKFCVYGNNTLANSSTDRRKRQANG